MKVKKRFHAIFLSTTIETLCNCDCISLGEVLSPTFKIRFTACMTTLSHSLMFSPFQLTITSSFKSFRDQPIYRPGWYIGRYLSLTDISVSAKTTDFIGLSRCWQNTVIFLTHPNNLHKKTQQTKSRQLSYSNASRCGFINKQTRLTMEHASAVVAETKASSGFRKFCNAWSYHVQVLVLCTNKLPLHCGSFHSTKHFTVTQRCRSPIDA